MKIFKYWIFIISLFLPILILFGTDIGIPGGFSNALFGLILCFPFAKYSIGKKHFLNLKKYVLVLAVCIALIIFNILLSIEILNSLIYWIIYILFIYSFNSWLIALKKENEFSEFLTFIKEKLGYSLLLNVIIIYIGLIFFNFGNAKTFNSFGIITGSVLVYFWFLKPKNSIVKFVILSILMYFLIVSLSRSSLVFALLTIVLTELVLLKAAFKRKIFLLFVGALIVGIFSDKLISWFSEKQFVSGTEIDTISDISKLNDDRDFLIQNFYKVYDDIYFIGYGVNSKYQDLQDWNNVDNVAIHNGILEMILMIGVPLSLVFLYFFFISFKRIIKFAMKDKSYSTLFGFVMYCLIRSYGESYFLLNVGNIMSIFLILILIVVYNNKLIK